MVRSLRFGPQDRPQPARVAGIAATLALHVVALMLLLIPLSAPRQAQPVDITVKPRWVIPDETLITPITPRPEQVTQVRPVPHAKPVPPITPQLPAVAADQAPYVDPAPTVPDLPGPVLPSAGVQPVSGPVSLSTLAYLSAPPPPYPPTEARSGVEGTVTLRILVGSDGLPLEVTVERSSGSRNLDRAALRQVKDKWRFQPAVREGQAVQAYGLVPVAFSLQ